MVIADDHSNLRHRDVVILFMVQIQQFKCAKQSSIENTAVSPVFNNRKTMQRFLTALQFFRCAGYVVLTVDHRTISYFKTIPRIP